MDPRVWNTTNFVILSLGIALAVFFAGIPASIAAGHTPPTAAWAAGSAVSGALIGLLVPAPRTKKTHVAAAEAAEAIERHASVEAANHIQQAEAAAGPAADEHRNEAAAAQATPQ